jgi:hypothetical protein
MEVMPENQAETENTDRRRHPRLPIRVDVHCNSFQEGKVFLRVSSQSEDLGVGGLSLTATQPVPPGLKMLVSFFLPFKGETEDDEPVQSLPVIARARVAWCQLMDRNYRLGLEFNDINPYSRDLFQSFLSTYQTAST